MRLKNLGIKLLEKETIPGNNRTSVENCRNKVSKEEDKPAY
jgi:hypothetical protein